MILFHYVLFLFFPLGSVAGILDFLFDKGGKGPAKPAVLDLPYGSFKSEYNKDSDIHVFRNVPYAAPPVGELRWAKPAPPKKGGTHNAGLKPTCPQAIIRGLNFMGSGNKSPVGTAINQFIGGLPVPSFGEESEDCLYMDIYVPSKALASPSKPLPVAVFIFGGGFILGSKDIYQPQVPFYDGTGMISQSKNSMIFITFNYRLGAFGFLAGTSMEEGGLPNAGLWDQRAVFEWVRSYVHLLGGDPGQVTAMGESAGASSIMHHLVAEGGKLDPLFRRAVLLSPAYQPMWDRAGGCESTFQDFASLSGCKDDEGKGAGVVECLRKLDSETLMRANKDLLLQQVPGTFAVGPTPDGSLIRQLPALELASGNFWPLESLVLSHCADEAAVFVDGSITTNDSFDSFLSAVFPNYTEPTPLHAAVLDHYPPVKEGGGGGSKYATQQDRVADLVRDSSMTCNIRYLTEAYTPSRVWNMQYSVSPGWHGTDLVAVFNNPHYGSSSSPSDSWEDVLTKYVLLPLGILFSGISTVLQSYLVSYVLTGDPNTRRAVVNLPPAVRWDHPQLAGEKIKKVLDVGNFLVGGVEDGQVPGAACGFWREFYAAAAADGGYVPPGGEVEQGLMVVEGNISARY
ncbi:related to triacylglycerol lipase I precursor [Cephalotrichum gorgonifer]|uniref:Related to triacylglycerol lipase I n=1 Tax=Cephalotrichum gorgonifer TaxID=2041049 RepID=A0AAE8SYC6_9PEZI|nr:related to triacylglycerol lipase I precursor [Cephalotrichum gorgonifer]